MVIWVNKIQLIARYYIIYMIRIFGYIFDSLSKAFWPIYKWHLKSLDTKVIFFGKSEFYCKENEIALIQDAINDLKLRCPESYDLLCENNCFSFILAGDNPVYSRPANRKFVLYRSALSYGVDGILATIGFAIALEEERKNKSDIFFKLFPPEMNVVKSKWLNWMEALEIEPVVFQFYKSTPLHSL